jgi:hypothetical protein
VANHRVDQVVDWVMAQLKDNLATTGARVYRGRAYPLPDDKLPAIAVSIGPDEKQGETTGFVDSRLVLNLEAKDKDSDEQVLSKTLNQIRAEIEIKLKAEECNRPEWITDLREVGAGAQDIEDGADRPIGVMPIVWEFDYRRSYADPTQ